MKTSSLFLVGLIAGALTVFTLRATSTTGVDAGSSERTDRNAHVVPEDPHADHDMGPSPAPAPEPAPAPAPAAHDHAPGVDHSDHGDTEPVNLICPVMGNEVDPDVYVDHEGRRIGFCCPPCIPKFKADPAKYLKKVDAEIAAREGGK